MFSCACQLFLYTNIWWYDEVIFLKNLRQTTVGGDERRDFFCIKMPLIASGSCSCGVFDCSASGGTRNLYLGDYSPAVCRTDVDPPVGCSGEHLVGPSLEVRSPPEAVAVYMHCLQILSTETNKIWKFLHNSPAWFSWPVCFTLRGV